MAVSSCTYNTVSAPKSNAPVNSTKTETAVTSYPKQKQDLSKASMVSDESEIMQERYSAYLDRMRFTVLRVNLSSEIVRLHHLNADLRVHCMVQNY